MSCRSCLATPLLAAACSYVVVCLLQIGEAFMVPPGAYNPSSYGKTVVIVPLDTQHVPVVSGGRQVAMRTAYYGKILVGAPRPQNFSVVFDTGSGHLIVPSAECTQETCLLHHRYDHAASKTSTRIHHDGTVDKTGFNPAERDQVSIGYGTGDITGDFVRDTVCLGGTFRPAEHGALHVDAGFDSEENTPANCASVRVITAVQMSSEPFMSFKFDGVLGLGLPSLALDPEFHFFGQLAKRMQIAPIFSFFLSKSDDVRSEIAFGGHDSKRMMGGEEAVKFVPVERPQDGFWRVRIRGVRVGNRSLSLCDNGACTGIIDTGTSTIAIPPESSEELFAMTERKLPPSLVDGKAQVPESELPDCRQVPGPPLIFDLGDFEIVLQADDYSRLVPEDVDVLGEDGSNVTHSVCRARLLPTKMPSLGERVFILGKPVLQKYYTTYDLEGPRIGFVTAVHPSSEQQLRNETTVV